MTDNYKESLQIQCDTVTDITPSLILRLRIFFLPYYELSKNFTPLCKPH